jgi:hypothetical protein
MPNPLTEGTAMSQPRILPVLAILAAAALMPAASLHAATVTFADPSSLVQNTTFNVLPNTDFSVDIIGTDFTQLNGGSFSLSYNESVVAITSVVIDPYWDFSPSSGSDSGVNTWGIIGFDIFNSGPASGNFRIATVNLSTKSPPLGALPSVGASSVMNIINSDFVADQTIFPTISNATINVVPLPATAWLLVTGMVALFGRAGRRYLAHR